jgi:hypothetical protein
MPKIKEFFSLLKEQGRINNPKFDELIEKLPDFEIDTEAQAAFENSFLTVDRAVSHPSVKEQIRVLALKPITKSLDKIISSISGIDKNTADKLLSFTRDAGRADSPPDTYGRIEYLSNSIDELFEKVKGSPNGDDQLKKELEKAKGTIHDLTEKFSVVEKDYTSKSKTLEKDFSEKLEQYKLDSELEKLAGNFTLADAYEKNRRATNDLLLTDLKKSNLLKLGSKDGQTLIEVYDDKGEPRFNGNTPVTIHQLMEDRFKPFLKQSNVEAGGHSSSHPKQSQTFTVNGNQNPLAGRGPSTSIAKKA